MIASLPISIPPLPRPITYHDSILMIGSCFTEHIATRMEQLRFDVLSNPHGILFNPLSVAHSLDSYIDGRQYIEDDLFYLNELWNSWDHHTRFSHINKGAALAGINNSQDEAAAFIRKTGWIIITLGSAFQYFLVEGGRAVANNHRAPGQWFEKRLLPISNIVAALNTTIEKLAVVNPTAQVLFTISPVRHIRDGVADNNRSKARLIEAVHTLCERYSQAHYFPAYELVIDVLRDYRYYDADMVHPNYAATSIVFDQFVQACTDPATQKIMQQVNELATAARHRPRFEQTQAHQLFMHTHAEKTRRLQQEYPFLRLWELEKYFDKKNT